MTIGALLQIRLVVVVVVKNGLVKNSQSIYRVLEVKEEGALLLDCVKRTAPVWVSDVSQFVVAEEIDARLQAGIAPRFDLSQEEERISNERFTMISGVIPFIAHEPLKRKAVAYTANQYGVSKKTILSYLYLYLAFQDKSLLSPKQKTEKPLTSDQKNMRWALNKFFYTRNGKSLADTYIFMLKEKYCDTNKKLLPEHPTLDQFRYFYRKTKSLQTYYISRDGIKDYQMNHRPLLGDGVQEFAPAVGVGMLDSTICDIYLVDRGGNLVGRPVLTVCVDAYSSLCCGYSLGWEGGMYSLRDLLLNCLSNKVELCKKNGIIIQAKDWNCSGSLMGKYVTDKGSEYASYNFEQLTELGCELVNLPSFRAELKGPVEKLFDLVQDEYKKILQGRGVIQEDFQKRGAHDYRKDACLTIEDFERIVLCCILYYNRDRLIENYPYTADMLTKQIPPHASDFWNYGLEQPGCNLIPVQREQLVRVLLPRTTGKFTRKGLVVNGMRYHCDGYTEQYLRGGSVIVAYNPENASIVYLVADGYKHFNLIENRYRDMPLGKVAEMKQQQKELIGAYREEKLQAKINLMDHIQTIAQQTSYSDDVQIKGIREARTRARNERHKDFVYEVVQDKDGANNG